MVRKAVGGVITAAPYIASGAGHAASGVGSVIRGAVNAASYAGSLLPTNLDEAAESNENDRITDHAEQQANIKQLEKRCMRDVRDHLEEVSQQQKHNLIV